MLLSTQLNHLEKSYETSQRGFHLRITRTTEYASFFNLRQQDKDKKIGLILKYLNQYSCRPFLLTICLLLIALQ